LRVGRGGWDVTTVAPTFFHGHNDLRPVHLESLSAEPCRLEPVASYLTRFVHLFLYSPRLRGLLAHGWDLVHCWEEPYILAGGQVAWWPPRGPPLVFRTAQSLPKHYPPPFNWIEHYAMARAAGWICSGRTVAQTLCDRPGYAGRPMRLIPLGVDTDDFH